jgi:hypothetical protein
MSGEPEYWTNACACFLKPAFYEQQAAGIANSMNWPVGMISATPKCVWPACATSKMHNADNAPCSDRVQQKCVQETVFDSGGNTYSPQGVELLAKCILTNKPKTPPGTTPVIPPTTVPTTTSQPTILDSFINRIQGYIEEYSNPATPSSRKQTIFMGGAVVVGIVGLLLLTMGGDEDDDSN